MAGGAFAVAGLILGVAGLGGCDGGDDHAGHTGTERGASAVHLEARAGSGKGPFARASYQEKPGEGAELDITVEAAPPGGTHVVTLDGRELGKLVTDLDGEGDLEFGPEALAFPAGFVAPGAGSALKIGTLVELVLSPLERLAHLEAEFEAGKVKGKASFKLELLAGERTREFKLRVTGAPPDTTHPVRLGGVEVGTLEVGSDGKGKLEYSEVERAPFPAGFPVLEAGTRLELGGLFAGPLLASQSEAR